MAAVMAVIGSLAYSRDTRASQKIEKGRRWDCGHLNVS
jgi:hypothetical protein